MAKFSKEELRKKLASQKSTDESIKLVKKTRDIEATSKSTNTSGSLMANLKKLGWVALVIVILLGVIIYLKETTVIFDKVADYIYSLIN